MRVFILLEVLMYTAGALRLQKTPKDEMSIEHKLVFDLGMNDGSDTENFLKMGYNVVAVEANPEWAKEVSKKSQESDAIKEGKLKILNVGIADDPEGKPLDFWIPTKGNNAAAWEVIKGASLGGASFSKFAACRWTGSCEAKPVATKTCSKLLEQEGTPHYLKIDIEGHDFMCFKDIMKNRCGSDQLPKYVSFENYGTDTLLYGPEYDAKELMALMHKRGYTTWKRARTWASKYNATMGEGSAFGEDLLDLETTKQWKPTTDFKEKLGCDVGCDSSSWQCLGYCDMHAKLDPEVAAKDCEKNPPTSK